MNDQVYSVQELPKKSRFKKILSISLIMITLIIITSLTGLVSYLVGREKGKNQSNIFDNSATSLFSPTQTSTPTISPKANPSATISATISKSKKISLTPTPLPKSTLLISTKSLDGYATSAGSLYNNVEIRVGRNRNFTTRGFLSFDITKIPIEAKIQSAILRIFQVKTVGDPYTKLGKLEIDHLNFGDILDDNDYSIPAILNGFQSITKKTSSEWKEIDVTPQLKDDISNTRSTSQYRLHFDTEIKGDDVIGDFVYFESADNSEGTTYIPQLVIKYY